MCQDYYVYIHYKKSNGEPFYVGKGIKNRDTTSVGRNDFWHMVVNKHDYVVERVANNLTEPEALKFEQVLIKSLGRRDLKTGSLVNLTDGGEGMSGYIHSQEFKDAMSALHSGKEVSEDTREKLRQHNLGNKHSEEARAKMSVARQGSKNPNADKTIYHFTHKDGETFIGTPWEMRERISKELGRMSCKLTGITSGRRKSMYGWSLKNSL